MVASINASTSAGVVTTADTSGILALQTAGTTAVTLDASQNATFAGSVKTNTLTSASATALTLQSAGTTAITVDTSQNVNFAGKLSFSYNINYYNQDNAISNYGPTNNLYVSGNGTTAGGLYLQGGGNQKQAIFIEGISTGGNITFQNNGSERMRITSAGYLLVGKTTTGSDTVGFEYEGSGGALLLTRASNATCLFNRQGSSGSIISFRFQNGDCGTISVNTGSTAYNTSSDYRLKENIAPLTSGLDKVAQLKPVTYKWKSDGSYGEGFIAHELAEVCPLAVHGEKDAVDENGKIVPQGIDTSFLVATLTAALQETKALIDTQAETINALTARIVAVEK
jgi:hypothetical protein